MNNILGESSTARYVVHKFLRTKDGRIVVAEWPNSYAWLWMLAQVMKLISSGWVERLSGEVAFAVLIVWCFLEITQGVNLFRKTLGIAVLVAGRGVRVL